MVHEVYASFSYFQKNKRKEKSNFNIARICICPLVGRLSSPLNYYWLLSKMATMRLGVRLAHTARAVVFSNYGPPAEALSIIKHTIPEASGSNVVLRLVACPVNPSDINQIEGVYPSKPVFTKDLGTSDAVAVAGNEGCFEVIEVGPEAQGVSVGDWVLPRVSAFGTWATHKLADINDLMVLGKPHGITPVQAATLSINPCTAYRMLSDFASLEPNDWFIQNGGNSGVGRMAIQLGKVWGYKSISVVRDRRDIDGLKQELTELGADKVVTEEQISDRSIKHIIKDWTHGQPIKLGLNCVGGKSATNVARQLGQGGKLVTYGGMSKQPVALPTSLYIFKDISSHGFWMTRWNEGRTEARERMIKELAGMYRNSEIQDTAISTHPLELDASDSEIFTTFQEALTAPGKNVIVPNAQ